MREGVRNVFAANLPLFEQSDIFQFPVELRRLEDRRAVELRRVRQLVQLREGPDRLPR